MTRHYNCSLVRFSSLLHGCMHHTQYSNITRLQQTFLVWIWSVRNGVVEWGPSSAANMNKDREEIERQLQDKQPEDASAHRHKILRPGANVWDRLSNQDRRLMKSTSPKAFKGCPVPARFHAHAADYSETAFQAAMIGSVPPLPGRATEMLSYHDPGGASTLTELEALTLKMINNHEASDKLKTRETRDQAFDRGVWKDGFGKAVFQRDKPRLVRAGEHQDRSVRYG